MDRIAFALVVNGEIGIVLLIDPVSKLNTTFRLSPTVIDITNLETMPPIGAIWNGESFNIPEDLMPLSDDPYKDLNPEVFRVFAYVVNNVFVGRSVIRNDNTDASRLFAVYGSNPEFVDITDQTITLGIDPFSVVGRQIVDSQIVPA
jgi:hypothetical protein